MRILLAPSAGGLNIEGKQVDACVNNGTACGQPAADAFCKYIGFDGANPDMEQTAPADEPVRAVTGETSGHSRLAVSLQAKCCLVTVPYPVPPWTLVGCNLGPGRLPKGQALMILNAQSDQAKHVMVI